MPTYAYFGLLNEILMREREENEKLRAKLGEHELRYEPSNYRSDNNNHKYMVGNKKVKNWGTESFPIFDFSSLSLLNTL